MNMTKRKALLLVPVAVLIAASAMSFGGCTLHDQKPERIEETRVQERRANVARPSWAESGSSGSMQKWMSDRARDLPDRTGAGEGGGGGGGGGSGH